MKKKALWIGIPGLAIGIAIAATSLTSLQGRLGVAPTDGRPAPEFSRIAAWPNSPPLTMRGLRGKVVWIDFWTYSCINCIRTLPSVREFYARYHAAGLEIVGVHSPEFDFEKSEENVRAAIARNHIPYPVAMDNEMATWRAYRNQYWPRIYLVDRSGVIRYDYIGEGGDAEIQRHLRDLLVEPGRSLPAPIDVTAPPVNPHITREIYAGSARGGDDSFTLRGSWENEPEFIRATEDGARLVLPFVARDVFVVASPDSKAARVTVLLDGKPLAPEVAGKDVRDGTVTVDRDDLYALVHLREAERHELTLVAGKGFKLFTFTFG